MVFRFPKPAVTPLLFRLPATVPSRIVGQPDGRARGIERPGGLTGVSADGKRLSAITWCSHRGAHTLTMGQRGKRRMHPATRFRAVAWLGACVVTVPFATPALAEPNGPIPGNGVFQVGADIAPGTYQTQGPSTPLIFVFGNVSPISFCSWSTHSTPVASPDDIVEANSSLGPMYAKIPETAVAFKTENCDPWIRVS